MASNSEKPMPFYDFPIDVQLNILSFLSPTEIYAFACTCRRFAALCSPSADIWLSLCERRWGSKTHLRRWSSAPSPRLYKALDRWENLIGFWRRSPGAPPLVFFEWAPSCIIGSRVSPSPSSCSYAVRKIPFLWLGISPAGGPLTYLHPGRLFDYPACLDKALSDSDVIPVTISFMGCKHFIIEESLSFCGDQQLDDPDRVLGLEAGSPPDRLMSEIYQYFANRTISGGEKYSRKMRKKVKERLGKRSWKAEHFVRIANSCPTPDRPLQGLWKGICEDMNLDFFLVAYDDVGGLTCRQVGDTAVPFPSYCPVFWASNTSFLESPFPREEQVIYNLREHVGCSKKREVVCRILCINCSYDLLLPELAGSSGDFRNVEGRIWQYEDGTYGFGFLRNNFIVDLKHIWLDGCLLDTLENSRQGCSL
ncbi:hypothetical protein HPP92_012927 [Vanilla planifolia]|uniref:F-box protein n=1 Tax=Vanilla planifolia TaxID=51239 RepID=A0A835UYB4_VANPL|nr:hypothetical protein HPP92_012927 [Vanilla planifolia]